MGGAGGGRTAYPSDAVAQAAETGTDQMPDCLPYLKSFNVVDIVNIHGRFSKVLSRYNSNNKEIMMKVATAKKKKITGRQWDVAKGGVTLFFLICLQMKKGFCWNLDPEKGFPKFG